MITITCDYCKNSRLTGKDVGVVKERDKTGKYTGRYLKLCKKCSVTFYRMEIKHLEEKMGGQLPKLSKILGMDENDIKRSIELWNTQKNDFN